MTENVLKHQLSEITRILLTYYRIILTVLMKKTVLFIKTRHIHEIKGEAVVQCKLKVIPNIFV